MRGRAPLRALGRIGVILLAFFVLIVLAIWIFQERLVFLPPPVPMAQGNRAERIEYASSPDQPLFGFLCRPAASDTTARGVPVVLVLHGNGDLADSWIDWGREVAKETGLAVFIAEYRGYGGLPGRPTANGVVEDARAAVRMLESRFGTRPADIVFYAHSLGSGIATKLAAESGARAVLLEAPITSILDVGRRNFGVPIAWVLPLVSRIDLEPINDVPRIEAPVWVAFGERDAVIPVWMPPAVFAAARQQGELLEVAGAGHGDVAQRGGDRYREWVRSALTRSGALSNGPRSSSGGKQ